jgi:prepilin-type N-terminal cleavage/methylation domain-containing protein/prepilin-type processing-associated H-X9-DG protein
MQPRQRFLKPRSSPYTGFSLVELLVVVAIIGLLAGLSVPAIGRAKAFSQQTTCTANLRTLHQATMNYASDNDGLFPCAINPTNNFAITLACEGYLGLSGAGFWERLDSWVALAQRRAAFCLWCPATEQSQPRPAFNMATYCMNVNVGQDYRVPSPRKTTQVTSPSKTALYIDGCFKDGSYQVWVGESGYMPAPIHPPYLYKQSNNPARSANVVFVDGHVEMRRIADIPTDFTDVFWTPNK